MGSEHSCLPRSRSWFRSIQVRRRTGIRFPRRCKFRVHKDSTYIRRCRSDIRGRCIQAGRGIRRYQLCQRTFLAHKGPKSIRRCLCRSYLLCILGHRYKCSLRADPSRCHGSKGLIRIRRSLFGSLFRSNLPRKRKRMRRPDRHRVRVGMDPKYIQGCLFRSRFP